MIAGTTEEGRARNRALWRASLIALAGAAISIALSAAVALVLPSGIARLVISSLVLSLALAITGFIVWSRTRPLAGDLRRPGLVAILAFPLVHDREWLGLLPLEGHHMLISAQFALTCIAFILAMVVYKWLQPIDAREAKQRRAEPGDVA